MPYSVAEPEFTAAEAIGFPDGTPVTKCEMNTVTGDHSIIEAEKDSVPTVTSLGRFVNLNLKSAVRSDAGCVALGPVLIVGVTPVIDQDDAVCRMVSDQFAGNRHGVVGPVV